MLSKWRLVGLYWAAQALFVFVAVPILAQQSNTVDGRNGRPLGRWDAKEFIEIYRHSEFWGVLAIVLLMLMLLQTVLVWPVRRPRMRRERGWALWLSVGVAALVGTGLAAGLVLGADTILTLRGAPEPDWLRKAGAWALIIWCVGSYVGGGVLLWRFCARGLKAGARHESLLGRIASTLFMGTLVEAVAIMPLDVMYRRRLECYSFAGTFGAYVVLLAAGLVTLGPSILVPVLARRRKRWYAARCDCCGYDMSGLKGASREIDRCPECGAGWKPD